MRRLSHSFFVSGLVLLGTLPAMVSLAAPSLNESRRSLAVSLEPVQNQWDGVDAEDPRLERLQSFFAKLECPIQGLEEDFLDAADQNNLDWRLLPALAVIESSGGKSYRNNNIFGWDSCRTEFPSVRTGIHVVASRLAHSRLYRDKDLDSLLRTYNSERSDYVPLVKSIMNAVGPDGELMNP
jgi:hypothetical protein